MEIRWGLHWMRLGLLFDFVLFDFESVDFVSLEQVGERTQRYAD
jgi:hypothetical protein